MAVKEMDLIRPHVSVAELIQRATYEVVAAFEAVVDTVQDHWARRIAARQLHAMPDHLLQDIGVERHQIDVKTGV